MNMKYNNNVTLTLIDGQKKMNKGAYSIFMINIGFGGDKQNNMIHYATYIYN